MGAGRAIVFFRLLRNDQCFLYFLFVGQERPELRLNGISNRADHRSGLRIAPTGANAVELIDNPLNQRLLYMRRIWDMHLFHPRLADKT